MNIERMLIQKAVHWSAPVPDGFGGFTYAEPVEIDVRWEERQERFLTPAGVELLSRAVVYTVLDLALGDYLALTTLEALGDTTDPQDSSIAIIAYKVAGLGKSPDIRAMNFLRKVWL